MVDRDLALIRERTGMDTIFDLFDFVCDFLTRFAVNRLSIRSAILFEANTDLTLPVLLVLYIVDRMACYCCFCWNYATVKVRDSNGLETSETYLIAAIEDFGSMG